MTSCAPRVGVVEGDEHAELRVAGVMDGAGKVAHVRGRHGLPTLDRDEDLADVLRVDDEVSDTVDALVADLFLVRLRVEHGDGPALKVERRLREQPLRGLHVVGDAVDLDVVHHGLPEGGLQAFDDEVD